MTPAKIYAIGERAPEFPAEFLTRGPVKQWLYFTTDDRPFLVDNFSHWRAPHAPTETPGVKAEGVRVPPGSTIEDDCGKVIDRATPLPADGDAALIARLSELEGWLDMRCHRKFAEVVAAAKAALTVSTHAASAVGSDAALAALRAETTKGENLS